MRPRTGTQTDTHDQYTFRVVYIRLTRNVTTIAGHSFLVSIFGIKIGQTNATLQPNPRLDQKHVYLGY